MNRVFIISYRPCRGCVGGGSGVNYKLYQANARYRLLDHCYHIFSDRVITPQTGQVSVASMVPKAKASKKGASALASRVGAAWITKHKKYRSRIQAYFRELDRQYGFTDGDVYLFQDVESACEFTALFGFSRTALIYHQQGSLYNEWRAFHSFHLPLYRQYLNRYAAQGFGRVAVLAFPSMGAKESLIGSEPYFKKALEDRPITVLYNGFTGPDQVQGSETIAALCERLNRFQGLKFATVSALNEAKGVERIPQYLAQVAKNHPLLWVVVGSGVKSDALARNIDKYGISEQVIWIKDPMRHDDILKLFSLTDAYILFHRYSIFDYSTIEAMSYGNIPVLTPVGGNLEVLTAENGVAVADPSDASDLEAFLASAPLAELKERNRKLQASRFSDEAFLDGYRRLVQSMNDEVR